MIDATTPCPHCATPVTAFEQYCPSCGMLVPSGPKVADEPTGGAADTTLRLPASSPGSVSGASEAEPATPEPLPPTSGATILDWEPEFVAKVEEAAKTAGKSLASFVRIAVQKEVALVTQVNRKRVTLDQAAVQLGTGRREVVALVSAGKLVARKIDGEWMIDQEQLDALDSKPRDETEGIARELEQLVAQAGLKGVITRGNAPEDAAATLCFVSQDAYLVFPQRAWKRLGPKGVMAEARDAIRRYVKRRDG